MIEKDVHVLRRGGPSDPPIDPALCAPSEPVLIVKLLGPPRHHAEIDLHVHVPVIVNSTVL